MSLDLNKTWVGLGAKTGFSFGPGYERFDGVIWNCDDYRYAGLRVGSLRIGIGVGASSGASLVMIFNAQHLGLINNRNITDWGVNIAIGDRLGSIVSAIRNPQAWASVVRVINTINNSRAGRALSSTGIRAVSQNDLDNLRNLASLSYSALDINSARQNNEPTVVVLDIPMMGVGAEISVNYLVGRAEIY